MLHRNIRKCPNFVYKIFDFSKPGILSLGKRKEKRRGCGAVEIKWSEMSPSPFFVPKLWNEKGLWRHAP